MTDFYIFVVVGVLSISFLAFSAGRSRRWRLIATASSMLAIGLALRFCGRTYPGVYYPNSKLLNDLLNGSGLFTEIGYALVLLFGVVDLVLVLRSHDTTSLIIRSLRWLRVVLLALIFAIIAYGFYYAVLFWQHWRM